MANANTAGYGCRQAMTVGNTPATGGQSEFIVQGGGCLLYTSPSPRD